MHEERLNKFYILCSIWEKNEKNSKFDESPMKYQFRFEKKKKKNQARIIGDGLSERHGNNTDALTMKIIEWKTKWRNNRWQ